MKGVLLGPIFDEGQAVLDPIGPEQVWEKRVGTRKTRVTVVRSLHTAPNYPQRWIVLANIERVIREDVLRRDYRRVS